MSSDPFSSNAWESEVRRAADRYMEMDDKIKGANEELKPYRVAKKDAKARLEALMGHHGVPKIVFDERKEFIELATRATKKNPDKELIQERCRAFFKGGPDSERLAEFVVNKVMAKVKGDPVPVLRRKKLTAAEATTAAGAANDDDDAYSD